jgi:hypothetical protein
MNILLAALLLSVSPGAESFTPTVELRGSVEGFPFSLGTTMYDGMWNGNKANESRLDWFWLDKAWWTSKFEEMEKLHLDALTFTHPHPYIGLIDVPGYPEARYFDEETLKRYNEMFHWILKEGKAHGVRVYFLTWNICLPPGFVKAHGVKEFGEDTKLTRDFTRAAIAELFREFPELGGLITMAAESPPGCVDFVVDAICNGMKDSGSNPELIFWSWCSYPEDSRRIVESYPRTRLLHYLQYEQFFLPKADPRIGRFSEACGGVPMVVLGGPKSVHTLLFWGDPEWARETVLDLRRQNATGFFIETYCEEAWLAHEAFARYAYSAEDKYDPDEWAKRIGEHYGVPELGSSLLAVMTEASRISPRLLALLHSQSDHFMPQNGLPLVYYLEMPTMSSYVFENVQTTDAEGYLRPNMGLCWPNPDWGEKVASIWECAKGAAQTGATTPLEIASAIEGHVDACEKALAQIETRYPDDKKTAFARVDNLLRLDAYLGRHYAEKIRAAMDWARFKNGDNTGEDCLRHLENSVTAWGKVVETANQVYSGTVSYWRSDLITPPPWTQNQIWGSYRMGPGHWRDQLAPFHREVEIVRSEIAKPHEEARLPLWESLRAPAPEKLETVFADDFSKLDETRWAPGQGCSQGDGSLLFDTTAADAEWHSVLNLRHDAAPMTPGARYLLSFDYRFLVAGTEAPDAFFAAGAHSDKGGCEHDFGDNRVWGGATNAQGHRDMLIAPETYDDYAVFFSIHGRAKIQLDNFKVSRVKN